MTTNLKENIWIQGFDSSESAFEFYDKIISSGNSTIYGGETSNIPEELARECLMIDEKISYWESIYDIFYIDYSGGFSRMDWKYSLSTACNQNYCIIYKINEDEKY